MIALIKYNLSNGWNIYRIVRVVLGVMVIYQAVTTANTMMTLVGVIFTAMPLLNIGCCGAKRCDISCKSEST